MGWRGGGGGYHPRQQSSRDISNFHPFIHPSPSSHTPTPLSLSLSDLSLHLPTSLSVLVPISHKRLQICLYGHSELPPVMFMIYSLLPPPPSPPPPLPSSRHCRSATFCSRVSADSGTQIPADSHEQSRSQHLGCCATMQPIRSPVENDVGVGVGLAKACCQFVEKLFGARGRSGGVQDVQMGCVKGGGTLVGSLAFLVAHLCVGVVTASTWSHTTSDLGPVSWRPTTVK